MEATINGEKIVITEPTWGDYDAWLGKAEITNSNIRMSAFYRYATVGMINRTEEWVNSLPHKEGKKLRILIVKVLDESNAEDDIKK